MSFIYEKEVKAKIGETNYQKLLDYIAEGNCSRSDFSQLASHLSMRVSGNHRRRIDSSESCNVYEMRNILSDWYCEVAYELDPDSAIQALSRALSHLPGMRPLVRHFQDSEAMSGYRPKVKAKQEEDALEAQLEKEVQEAVIRAKEEQEQKAKQENKALVDTLENKLKGLQALRAQQEKEFEDSEVLSPFPFQTFL